MIEVDTAAIAALRQRLIEVGGAPSLVMEGPEASAQVGHPFAHDDRARALFDATFELMFLMLEADGEVAGEEEELLRGAVRELTEGVARTRTILALATECARVLDREGKDERLASVAKVLAGHAPTAEAAFVLAATMAMADEEVVAEEHATIEALAKLLSFSDERANELLRKAREPKKAPAPKA